MRYLGVSAVLAALAAVVGAVVLAGCGGTTVVTTAAPAAAITAKPATTTIIEKTTQAPSQVKTVTTNLPASGPPSSGAAYDAPTSGTDSSPHNGTSCGGGVYVIGVHTSCDFAGNVESSEQENGGPGVLTDYSPVTGEDYDVTCWDEGNGWVQCQGGTNDAADLEFPGS
jgi:hypothetical protein